MKLESLAEKNNPLSFDVRGSFPSWELQLSCHEGGLEFIYSAKKKYWYIVTEVCGHAYEKAKAALVIILS